MRKREGEGEGEGRGWVFQEVLPVSGRVETSLAIVLLSFLIKGVKWGNCNITMVMDQQQENVLFAGVVENIPKTR